jgi:hypothetical protein
LVVTGTFAPDATLPLSSLPTAPVSLSALGRLQLANREITPHAISQVYGWVKERLIRASVGREIGRGVGWLPRWSIVASAPDDEY